MTRAIVYVRTDVPDHESHASSSLDYCNREGYDFCGLIQDDWAAAQKMIADRETTVIIVATEEHLDPKRKPRVEVVANQPLRRGRHARRTRWLRRNAEG